MDSKTTNRRHYKVCSGCVDLTTCAQATKTRRKCYQDWYNRARRDPEAEKLRLALFRQKNFANWMLCRCKSVALKSGLDFDLDLEWFKNELAKGVCAATDIVFVMPAYQPGARGKRGPWTPSVDRVDNAQGYVKTNCRLTVWIFNLAKSNYEDADIKKMCDGFVKVENERRQSKHTQDNFMNIPIRILESQDIFGNWSRECVH